MHWPAAELPSRDYSAEFPAGEFLAADCPADGQHSVVERSVVEHSAADFAAFQAAHYSVDAERFLFGHSAPVVEDAAPRSAAAGQHSHVLLAAERSLFGHLAAVVEGVEPHSAAAEQHSLVSLVAEPHSPGLRAAVVFPDWAALHSDDFAHSPFGWRVAAFPEFRCARLQSDAVRMTALEVSDCG